MLKVKFCKIKERYWLTYKFTMLFTIATAALKYFSFSLETFILPHNEPFWMPIFGSWKVIQACPISMDKQTQKMLEFGVVWILKTFDLSTLMYAYNFTITITKNENCFYCQATSFYYWVSRLIQISFLGRSTVNMLTQWWAF